MTSFLNSNRLLPLFLWSLVNIISTGGHQVEHESNKVQLTDWTLSSADIKRALEKETYGVLDMPCKVPMYDKMTKKFWTSFFQINDPEFSEYNEPTWYKMKTRKNLDIFTREGINLNESMVMSKAENMKTRAEFCFTGGLLQCMKNSTWIRPRTTTTRSGNSTTTYNSSGGHKISAPKPKDSEYDGATCQCMRFPIKTVRAYSPYKGCFVEIDEHCYRIGDVSDSSDKYTQVIFPCVSGSRCDKFSKKCMMPIATVAASDGLGIGIHFEQDGRKIKFQFLAFSVYYILSYSTCKV